LTTAVQPKLETLAIQGLHASVEGKEILRGVDLDVKQGEVHALMGPNGSGKSTLAYSVMGHPRYEITAGSVEFAGQNVVALAPDERARLGLFLSFQYPTAIPGVTMHNFLRTATKAVHGNELPPREFRKLVTDQMALLKMDPSFATRYVNDGFSGGEKKRAEILQMGVLRPKIAILDETDSGLDIDALRTVAEGVEALRGPELGVLLITHYLALEIESRGYDWITSGVDAADAASEARELSPAERAFAAQHQHDASREA
jgi:Fe-S cluster assembly ATP-binding protein